jgi:acyl transferase domain-containing protein
LRHPDEARADEAVLVENLGRLWLAGAQPDWRAFHAGHRRRRVRLPTYAFEPIRYWLEPAKASPVRERLGRHASPAEWVYAPSWKRAHVLPGDRRKRGANWLVFSDAHGLSSQLEAQLAGDGANVVRVEVGGGFSKKGPGAYALNPAVPADYERLLAQLKAAAFTPECIAHLWSVRRDEELRNDEAFSAECQDRGFYSLILLLQALSTCSLNGPMGLAVLTSHAHEVDGSETICPENALVLGPAKVVGMEYPNIRARSIDVSLDGDLQCLARTLADDLCAPWSEPVVAYRGRYRWVQAFDRFPLHAAPSSPGPGRDSGVYLITGGLGLVGLEIADFLARSARARLGLVGRRGLPERGRWPAWLAEHDAHDRRSRAIRRVIAMESAGAEVLVCSADVADEGRMREVVAQAEARFGALHGVVHAAGAEVRFQPIQTLQRSDCELQFRARVQGLKVLERVLLGKRLDFCLVNSSLASVMGLMDFATYTASQVFMDAFVHRHNKENAVPWRLVNWDHWVPQAEAGASAPAAAQVYYMRPEEATGVLSQFLAMPDVNQVLVSTGDLQGRIDQVILREEVQSEAAAAAEEMQAAQGHARPALSSEYAAPRNDTERLLADVWAKMLGIAQVGIHDNFFELGGDSVISIQIASKASQAGLRFTPKQAFDNQTIAALAAVLGGNPTVTSEPGGTGGKRKDSAHAAVETFGVSELDLAEIARQLGAQASETR